MVYGSYLAEFLLNKDYKVYGMYRRTSTDIFEKPEIHERLGKIKNKITLIQGDLTDSASIMRILNEVKPDEIYNLASQSFVPASWDQALTTGDINAIGPLRILEAIRTLNSNTRFYQASSSEMFGKIQEAPQNENTPLYPRSPYATAKVFAHWITVNYRESFGLHASSGIAFNHESPLRGKEFVTRKISLAAARIKYGLQNFLELGYLDAKRDWGFAGDYVEAMWLILQQNKPGDYVIATGENHTVREFIEEAFKIAGMKIEWEGEGIKEVGKVNGKAVVKINPKFYRNNEVNMLLGNYDKAKKILGWKPKTSFKELVKIMVQTDLKRAEKEARFSRQ